MEDRFSILRPLSMDELECFTFEIFNFFSPSNIDENRKLLSKVNQKSRITPFSVNDFFTYMKSVKGNDQIDRYRTHILRLIKIYEQADFLIAAGAEPNGYSLGGERCYYCMKELTNLQVKNQLWLGECLGLEFIQHKSKGYVVPITGKDENGNEGIGTGTLINNDTILTCAHVLNEMVVNKTVEVSGKKIGIRDIKAHTKIDVGIIKLSESVSLGFQMVFGNAYILDEILTMGFPPIPLAREAYLISQKGEINSFIENYSGDQNFIYSSITRPGNSGGPIFSKRGHIVGISVRHLEREYENGHNIVPFFEGITSNEILNALKEMEPNIDILYETYM